ncbi:MAG: type VII toxin-antitoxin system MntA family adenylyltransferase antitoxin [Chloroflexota bacterium]
MEVDGILTKAGKDADVVAVFLFGSRARGESAPGSDIDVCLVLRPGNYAATVLNQKRLSYLKEGNADVHIFSQLPLYIRHRVLKEGKILLCQDEDLLYEIAFRTAQAFEDFRHLYYGYLEELAHVGP